MKPNPPPPPAAPVTLQTVLDRLAGDGGLSDTRKRDLRSAVTSFAKLKGQPPAAIPLDLADIRRTLDGMVPARAQGITQTVGQHAQRPRHAPSTPRACGRCSGPPTSSSIRSGAAFLRQPTSASAKALSRFARWASLRRIAPEAVDDSTIDRFITELDAATLTGNLANLRRIVAMRGTLL